MGLFSERSKPEVRPEPQVLPVEEDRFDDLPSLPKPRASTVITEGITLTGKLFGEGVIQVEGIVEGELELHGSVNVTTTGLIRGPISADVVRIAGRVEGNVTARDHLRLEKTGQMEGDVATPSLVVEDGGRLNGRSTMLQPAQSDTARSSEPTDRLEFGPDYKLGEDGEGDGDN